MEVPCDTSGAVHRIRKISNWISYCIHFQHREKKRGIEALDCRLLNLFSSFYGIESGARFEILVPWLQAALHPNVVGATPGLEGLDIAWDDQGDLEEALTKGLARVLSSDDYNKFVNPFDYEWTRNF